MLKLVRILVCNEERKYCSFSTDSNQFCTDLTKFGIDNNSVFFLFSRKSIRCMFSISQVLKSINFTVEEGQTIALLGDKGSGKSTLIKLLQRIYDPQTGKVSRNLQLFAYIAYLFHLLQPFGFLILLPSIRGDLLDRLHRLLSE